MPSYRDHRGLVITTSSAMAAACYADGVQALVFGSSLDAVAMLRAAVAADPSLGVAVAALAWSTTGEAGSDPALLAALEAGEARSSDATRRERQHIEIVLTALRGDPDRARALGAEHLREFPDDVFVVHLVGR